MSDYDSVVCPKCKVGFAPGIKICPFCNLPLASAQEEVYEQADEAPKPIILDDDISSLEKLRTADPGWIHHLQNKLAEAGIPHCIEPSDPPRMSFSVFVRPEDLPRAKNIDDKLFAEEVPDGEEMPHVENLDFSHCPGCGSRLGENDLKCGSCGLNLSPTEDWKCPDCNEVIEENVRTCPHCGCEIDWSEDPG